MMSLMLLVSCTKKEEMPVLEDSKSTVVKDLAGDTGASVGDGVDGKTKRDFRTFLFNLKNKRQIWLNNAADSAKYLKTKDWDLAFTYIYNSIVYVNNGEASGNPGAGGPGIGGITYVEKPYSEVNEVPQDASFNKNQTFTGWDGWPQPYNFGWYFYQMSTHIARPIKNRTFILKTAEGKYAKLELINVYQGNPPVVTDLHWPAPYLTFRYFVQEDGSTNLKTN
ncbi:HmuY family protein [Mucilaginibacter sp. JRF]|nr:HmuY family protein [Mucilaginibacter sp. JRF]